MNELSTLPLEKKQELLEMVESIRVDGHRSDDEAKKQQQLLLLVADALVTIYDVPLDAEFWSRLEEASAYFQILYPTSEMKLIERVMTRLSGPYGGYRRSGGLSMHFGDVIMYSNSKRVLLHEIVHAAAAYIDKLHDEDGKPNPFHSSHEYDIKRVRLARALTMIAPIIIYISLGVDFATDSYESVQDSLRVVAAILNVLVFARNYMYYLDLPQEKIANTIESLIEPEGITERVECLILMAHSFAAQLPTGINAHNLDNNQKTH